VLGLTAAFFVSFYGHWGAPIWPPESFRRGSYLDRLFLAPPLIGLIGLAGILWTSWRGRRSPGGERGVGWRTSGVCALRGRGWALGLLLTHGSPGPGAIAVVSGMLGTLIGTAVLFGDTPWWAAAGLGCAAPAAWVVDRLTATKLGRSGAATARVTAAAVVAAA